MEKTTYNIHWHSRLKEGAKPCSVCKNDSVCFTAYLDENDIFSNVEYFCDNHRPLTKAL